MLIFSYDIVNAWGILDIVILILEYGMLLVGWLSEKHSYVWYNLDMVEGYLCSMMMYEWGTWIGCWRWFIDDMVHMEYVGCSDRLQVDVTEPTKFQSWRKLETLVFSNGVRKIPKDRLHTCEGWKRTWHIHTHVATYTGHVPIKKAWHIFFLSTSWVLYLRIGFLFLVSAKICRMGLASRFGTLFGLVLISIGCW